MSAENSLEIFRMENGEFWIMECASGAHDPKYQGPRHLAGRYDSYEAAITAFGDFNNEESENYIYTEIGVSVPSLEQLMKKPAHLLASTVRVRFARHCECFDHRDLVQEAWSVVECRKNSNVAIRVIRDNLSYSQALTLAQLYVSGSPGDCNLVTPTVFHRFADYENHDCYDDCWLLDYPKDES
jgi:hypothetical protein